MLIVMRIFLGAAFLHFARLAWLNAEQNPSAGDLSNAFYTAICVVLAIANAVVWAPYIGNKLSDPLTSTVVESTFVERVNYLMKLAQWFSKKRRRRTVLLLSFVEGIRNPWSPVPFLMGMRHARPGTWLEKVFAREVYRFGNIQNCVRAFQILKEHGCVPATHDNPEVNMAIMAMERQAPREVPAVKLPPSVPPPRLRRNRRIALFENDTEDFPEPAIDPPPRAPLPPAQEEPAQALPPTPVQPESFWLRWYDKLAVWLERR